MTVLERASAKRRPAGWVAPGPRPRGSAGRPELEPSSEEDLSYLTGDFRIFQRKRGHRWSLDDFSTALIAIRTGRALPSVERTADLGCGIGSMARRSIAFNGIDARCQVWLADLREAGPDPASCDLVTGTPPYIKLGHGLISDKEQKQPCFFETRGGLEDYCRAAARALKPAGRFVVCAGAQVGAHEEQRAASAAAAAGLRIIEQTDVIPRIGKPVLFRVYVMAVASEFEGTTRRLEFPVRDEHGGPTVEMKQARVELGLPDMER